eukprot:CAMPEP_0176147440 /NCGR_PEP_ID=MMETSP0120_2-20121206/75161_1 /TAXON_ID=160619 /ORGANISM="Kryptoperidinium foliaceum, Strain CCMP 1326" /LENGTH=206 /DNA_ID=CAMNT_0017484055 /DNA_START=27 /DNA_END=644 /DNA_ORIENTATION=-
MPKASGMLQRAQSRERLRGFLEQIRRAIGAATGAEQAHESRGVHRTRHGDLSAVRTTSPLLSARHCAATRPSAILDMLLCEASFDTAALVSASAAAARPQSKPRIANSSSPRWNKATAAASRVLASGSQAHNLATAPVQPAARRAPIVPRLRNAAIRNARGAPSAAQASNTSTSMAPPTDAKAPSASTRASGSQPTTPCATARNAS